MPTFNLSDIQSINPPEPGNRIWSPQQKAVFDHVVYETGVSGRVDAVAGAGKTTTLVHAASLMDTDRVAFTAFNKRIADEIKEKVRANRNVVCGTLHSFGLKAWKQTAPDCEVDGDKTDTIMEELRVPTPIRAFTKRMVSHLKGGMGKPPADYALMQAICDHYDVSDLLPDYFHEENDPFEYVNDVLLASIERATDLIDFDDMLYMPLNFGKIEAEYDRVLVDEAQDTNAMRRELIKRLVLPTGRVLAVGDPHQAIYGFTGADADAMDLIQQDFQATLLPLTVTYRCPKRIVEHAHQWVSHIQAADTAPEGIVRNLSARDFAGLGSEAFGPTTAILCRNTRPIVSLALDLIRRGIGARVEGRDIGQSLQSLANRWKSARSLGALLDKLDEHRDVEGRKLRNRGQRAKAAALEDKVNSLCAVVQSLPHTAGLYDLRQRITQLFGDTQPGETPRVCTLSTVHKSKGREWDRVYLLGREELMPSPYATQEWQLQQEKNLCYVAVTRAKKELVEVEYDG